MILIWYWYDMIADHEIIVAAKFIQGGEIHLNPLEENRHLQYQILITK